MSTATPLNLNESTEGMTFIEQPQPQPEPVKYSAEIIKEEKNNNSNIKNNTMDSTPLADIMGPPVANEPMMMMAEDPRMIQSPVQAAAAPPPIQFPQPQQQQQQQQQQKTNSFNLSDEQIQALFVGACAIIAFSKPIQDKLANLVPRFVGDDGARSTTGLAVTGLIAALVFYFGQRMIVNQTSRM
jgi:hypothetical protein